MKRYDPENLKIGQATALWLKRGGLYNPNDSDPTYQKEIGVVVDIKPFGIWIDLGADIYYIAFTEIAFFISYTEDN